jgi:hypothetical protein
MIKIGFGNRAKPRTFDYKPRFYDPAREELEARLKKYASPDGSNSAVEDVKVRIRTGLQNKWQKGNVRSQVRKSNLRLLYIILILASLAFILVSSNKITALVEGFTR